jgi:hypothetical protein
MVLGMSLSTFTTSHTVVSLIAIATGFIALFGMFRSKIDSWTAVFLAASVLTSVTGFVFPFQKVLPSHIVGALSLVILGVAIVALYVAHLAGPWRWLYVVTAVTALYLNVFVAVVQAFLKIPALKALAPKGNEPPFAIAQGVVLLLFVVLAIKAVRSLHPVPQRAAAVVSRAS